MAANHDHLMLKPEEIVEVLKNRWARLKGKESEEINIDEIPEEEINEMIINNEFEKFLEVFHKVFSEEEENDCEDGILADICSKVAEKIKNRLANADKSELLKFFFNFIKKIFIDKKSTPDGKN